MDFKSEMNSVFGNQRPIYTDLDLSGSEIVQVTRCDRFKFDADDDVLPECKSYYRAEILLKGEGFIVNIPFEYWKKSETMEEWKEMNLRKALW